MAWEKVTVDQDKSYTITGAPRVVDGKVLIGNGGAEFGVRGYIAAYDAADGEELWRFYTVPGDEGDDAPEYLKAAAETWSSDALAGEDGIGGGGLRVGQCLLRLLALLLLLLLDLGELSNQQNILII